MASNKNDNIRLLAPKPIDERYLHPSNRPWNSVSEALSGITYRHQGLMVNISGTIYWFRNGVLDIDLVIFIPEIDIPEIVDNLNSNATDKTLSANQGRILKEYIDSLSITSNQAAQELYLRDSEGNILSTLNVSFLNNEGTTFFYNETTQRLELRNDQGEVLSEVPVSAFVSNLASSLDLTGNALTLRDTEGNNLAQVTFQIQNISGLQLALADLQTAIDGKEDPIETDGTIYKTSENLIGQNITTTDYTVVWNEGESKVFTMPYDYYHAEVFCGKRLVNRTPDQYWRYVNSQIEITQPLVGEGVEITFKLHRYLNE
tara:strand:+ start:918 stop:1868 length:951 start_codon:yes stop_codon:yes gene_type:complete